MLFEQSELEPWLSRDRPGRRLLVSRNEPKQRCLSAPVPTYDSPSVATSDGKRDSIEDLRGAEFNRDVGDRDLGQDRSTLEQAARQRSTVSTV